MPDSDASSRPADTGASPANLPVPVRNALAGESEGFFARIARAIFGWRGGPTRADIEVVLEAAVPGETGVSPTERTMLQNILALRERRIEDVMVPRADIVAVQQDITLGELMKVFRVAAHSRLVVYNDTLDDPIGMVHIRDLLAFMTERAADSAEKNTKRKRPLPAGLELKAVDLALPLPGAKIVREMLFVPPSMPALDLLAKMQATHIHLALVVDEYGGTDGLVSIEDIVEQIVGDIADEHDDDVLPSIVRQPDGAFIADARATLEDVTSVVGLEFDIGDAAKEVDTLGGYMMAQSGRLPLRGELVAGPPGFEIEVLDADPRRIKKVRIDRSKDRPVERDRDGRRRYSGPDTTTLTIAPAPPAEPSGDDAAKVSSDTDQPGTAPNPPTPKASSSP
jgi:CBS domain containing-hemolysin-like protein